MEALSYTDPDAWSTAAVSRAVAGAASRLRSDSVRYAALDAQVVETRITTMIRALECAVRQGTVDRFHDDTVVAVHERMESGFTRRDIVLALDAVERAVEELILEHDGTDAVGSRRWRLIQQTLRRTERTALLGRSDERDSEACGVLSMRERQVLSLLAGGLGTQGVADRLCLSPPTVRTYVERSMEKLGAATRTHAVAIALTSGVLSPALGR